LGRFTTEEDIDYFIETLINVIQELKPIFSNN